MDKKIKPKKRSKLRIQLGKLFYTYKRYMAWHFNSKKYSKHILNNNLPIVAFTHQTPLLRKLKDVDMWFQYNKIVNLRKASEKLDGITIHPGETFSYWKLIGKPSKRKGYVDGMVLFYGGFKAGTGGGLCQLSNLIYWMTLHTPLTVTERHRHSFDVFPDSNRTQPFGSGATCVYNYRDLQIYNGTSQVYQLRVHLIDEYLIGEWRTTEKPIYSYEIYEKDHKITHDPWCGYVRHNVIYRKTLDSYGELVRDEYITENHAIMMYQPFLSEGTRVD
mgnify:FL=1